MATLEQSQTEGVLHDLGFEPVEQENPVCGGPAQYRAGDRAKSLLEPVLAGEAMLEVSSGGEISII